MEDFKHCYEYLDEPVDRIVQNPYDEAARLAVLINERRRAEFRVDFHFNAFRNETEAKDGEEPSAIGYQSRGDLLASDNGIYLVPYSNAAQFQNVGIDAGAPDSRLPYSSQDQNIVVDGKENIAGAAVSIGQREHQKYTTPPVPTICGRCGLPHVGIATICPDMANDAQLRHSLYIIDGRPREQMSTLSSYREILMSLQQRRMDRQEAACPHLPMSRLGNEAMTTRRQLMPSPFPNPELPRYRPLFSSVDQITVHQDKLSQPMISICPDLRLPRNRHSLQKPFFGTTIPQSEPILPGLQSSQTFESRNVFRNSFADHMQSGRNIVSNTTDQEMGEELQGDYDALEALSEENTLDQEIQDKVDMVER